MSIHPSLGSAVKGKKQRTVLKRAERIKHHIGKDEWTEESNIFGLPKIKLLRLKIAKKEKAEKPEEGTEGTEATAETKATPATQEKSKEKSKDKK